MQVVPPFSPAAARVLGCLVEKELTVPDTYPMTVNALVSAANQSTSRFPLMELSTAAVMVALDELKVEHRLVRMLPSGAGSRVDKYRHVLEERFGLSRPEKTVVALLLLRGAQTVGELNTRSGRMHEFASLAAVEAVLDRLCDPNRPADPTEPTDARESGMLRTAATPGAVTTLPDGYQRTWPGPLVVRLPRQPGQHEPRVMHLLCGEVDPAAIEAGATTPARTGSAAGGVTGELSRRVEDLEAEVATLRARLESLEQALGG